MHDRVTYSRGYLTYLRCFGQYHKNSALTQRNLQYMCIGQKFVLHEKTFQHPSLPCLPKEEFFRQEQIMYLLIVYAGSNTAGAQQGRQQVRFAWVCGCLCAIVFEMHLCLEANTITWGYWYFLECLMQHLSAVVPIIGKLFSNCFLISVAILCSYNLCGGGGGHLKDKGGIGGGWISTCCSWKEFIRADLSCFSITHGSFW